MRSRVRPATILILLLVLAFPFFLRNVQSTSPPILQWARTWGGTYGEIAYGVAVDLSGNSYITGETGSFGASTPGTNHTFLVKFDASGGLVWQRVWGGTGSSAEETGRGVAVDGAGDIFVAGETSNFDNNVAQLFVLKFNSTGDLQWQREWNETSAPDHVQGIAVDDQGNSYVTGYADSIITPGKTDIFLLKFSSTGALVWQQAFEKGYTDYAFGVAVNSSGTGVFVTGSSAAVLGFPQHMLLVAFDSSGNLLWDRTWGGAATADQGFADSVDASGNILVTGYTTNFGAGGNDVVILKFDPAGTLLWQKTWGGSGSEMGQGVAADPSGSVYVAGWSNSFHSSSCSGSCTDAVLLKLSSSGNLLSQAVWGDNGDDRAYAVAVKPSGNAIVAGNVNEGPPYTLGSGNDTLGVPNFGLGTTLGTTMILSIPEGTPNGAVITPSGMTGYVGSQDALLFEAGSALPPSAPQGLVATPGLGNVTLRWNPPASNGGASVTGYSLYRGISSNGEGATPYMPLGNQTMYADTGLSSSVTYFYKVTANNSAGESSFSNEISAAALSPSATVPSAPRNLAASPLGTNGIVLTWTPPSSNGSAPITGYKIYRGTSPGGEASSPIKILGNFTTFTDTSASEGVTYYYTVRASNGVGDGAASNEASATIQGAGGGGLSLPELAGVGVIVAILVIGAVYFLRRGGKGNERHILGKPA